MGIPDKISTHEKDAPTFLTQLFREKPVIDALVRVHARRMQGIEDEIWKAIEGRLLADCEGVWLDAYGEILLEQRLGRTDVDYRQALLIRVRVLRSRGRTIDLIDIMRMFSTLTTYIEYFPMAWEVSLYDVTIPPAVAMLRSLSQAKAAGSYGVLLTSTWAEAEVMKWDYPAELAPDLLGLGVLGETELGS